MITLSPTLRACITYVPVKLWRGGLGHGRVGEMFVVTVSSTVFSTNRTGLLHQMRLVTLTYLNVQG